VQNEPDAQVLVNPPFASKFACAVAGEIIAAAKSIDFKYLIWPTPSNNLDASKRSGIRMRHSVLQNNRKCPVSLSDKSLFAVPRDRNSTKAQRGKNQAYSGS
jgi:hypothetical protein